MKEVFLSKEKLLAVYKKEPVLHQRILQIKALLFFMKNKNDFADGISRSELRTEDQKKLNPLNVNPILARLQKKQLLIQNFNCNPDILHEITKDAIDPNNSDSGLNLSILTHYFNYNKNYQFQGERIISNVRIIHIAVHLNDYDIFLNAQLEKPDHCVKILHDLLDIFYLHSLDSEWVTSRHPVIQLYLLCIKLFSFYNDINQTPPDLEQWIDFIKHNDCIALAIKNNLNKIPKIMSCLLQLSLIFKGLSYVEQSLGLLSLNRQYFYYEALGTLEFFNGKKLESIQHYDKARRAYKLDNLSAIFYVLALLLNTPTKEDFKKAATMITSLERLNLNAAIPNILNALLYIKSNDCEKAKKYFHNAKYYMEGVTTSFSFLYALIDWIEVLLEPEKLSKLIKIFRKKFRSSRDNLQALAAQIYAELIGLENERDEEVQDFFKDHTLAGHFKFMNIFPVKHPWEYAIDQLHNIVTEQINEANQQTLEKRLVWIVDPASLKITVAEQTFRKNNTWGMPKPIALKRIYNLDPKLDYLTPQDKAVITGLDQETYGWYNQEQFFWNTRRTLMALIGHPLVFHGQNLDVPIELVQGAVELQVEKTEKGYHISLSKFSAEPHIFLEQEATNRYRVIDFSDEMVSISQILSKQGMTVPFQAKDRVVNMICNAKTSIHIQSDVADDDCPIFSGDATPCAHLFPIQDGLKINLWIKPLGEQGSYYRAAQGKLSIIATVKTAQGEERRKIIRDFDKEKNNINALIDQCRSLAEFNENTDEWDINTLGNSLELLLELEEYKKNNPLNIEWPKGQTLRVKQSISSKNLSLSIKGSQFWFEYEGEVKIDEDHVLGVKNLLDLLDQSQGRFVRLASGEFVALTEKFKKQLEDVRALSDGNKIYHLSTSSLRELAEEAGSVEEDQAWHKHLKRLTAMEKHQPVIPSTLQAELRDYQKDGFAYLSRLAHWQIGACLADDMGLGKTIQTIALLLLHAQKGPCLVIAPTSVCFVWLEELTKFAPTLIPHKLYNLNDRKALIDSLGKMNILICSYGLLHQAGDLLLDKSWEMIILDEAQAIKNPETKRWKYATQLNGKCRIALTGTPIENHLGELWSIFRFLNPGLLGSLSSFQQRFSGPIEKYNDPIAKRALKNLVSPYILRRTKSEVLLELPPKIEQSILIEPSPEELGFYEAVRIKALERINNLNQSEGKQTNRFSILAEITRLRQACCHAALVDENITIASSKIKNFLTLVKNIIDNKHKALVFSQFVRYLDKIKEVLDQENINYQYLDGSTPIKDRQRAVEEFQAGIGDLFLISLKAGGTGLNLTAADYVIILDPWWNPAVEDQAADRAHRMGQIRPVTVYRLIMKNSIEEKILTLHKGKRDLAADLLSGSDVSGKISEEELMGLIAA